MKRKIYLATSWKNEEQPLLVNILREENHEVYDFRHPSATNNGFRWTDVSKNYKEWTPAEYTFALSDPIAQRGFGYDKAGLDWCDTCVLLLPCGRSAHLEAGYARGKGKELFILLREQGFEPELMYLFANSIVTTIENLVKVLG
ncbi:MAG: hypothetical protein C5B59_17350 [Bacteroidetes bacterium]|nr:MAG: hypothetical protein C5B59_17350 [Bacteroidota bacterium]